MRIFELQRPKYSGASERETLYADFVTIDEKKMPSICLGGTSNFYLPLDEARRLARKILSIPTPLNFQELPDI